VGRDTLQGDGLGGSKMNRHEYQLFAQWVHDLPEQISKDRLIDELVRLLANDNANFYEEKFRAAIRKLD